MVGTLNGCKVGEGHQETGDWWGWQDPTFSGLMDPVQASGCHPGSWHGQRSWMAGLWITHAQLPGVETEAQAAVVHAEGDGPGQGKDGGERTPCRRGSPATELGREEKGLPEVTGWAPCGL